MIKEPVYIWEEETGYASCTLTDDKGRIFIGEANVHPDDSDFMSEKTGCHIAMIRASIKYLQSVKRDELKPQLAALKQLYYSWNRSKEHSPRSYESKMLYNHIKMKESDIQEVNIQIHRLKEELRTFIDDKDRFYRFTRNKRGQNCIKAPF